MNTNHMSSAELIEKKRPLRRTISKNTTKAERPSCSIAITKVCVLLKSIKYRKIDQNWSNKQQVVAHVVLFLDRVTTGHPRLMEMPTDHFSADPFPIGGFAQLLVKGLTPPSQPPTWTKRKTKDKILWWDLPVMKYQVKTRSRITWENANQQFLQHHKQSQLQLMNKQGIWSL